MKKMKKSWKGILALALILTMSIPAFAETATETTENPVVTEEAAPAEEKNTEETSSAEDALTEAYSAFGEARRNAREQKRQEALKAELDAYVKAGQMTQEQADLILKDAAERSAARKEARNAMNGKCQPTNRKGNGQSGQMPGNGGRSGRGKQMTPGMGNNYSAPQNGNSMMPQGGRNNTGRGAWNNGMMPQNGNQYYGMPYMGGQFQQ